MPIYIKFENPDINGDVTAAGFEGQVEVLSFSWGLSNTGTLASGGGGAGKASFQDLHFETGSSQASPQLAKECATGEHIQKATLSVVKSGQQAAVYYKVVLEDVLVSSFQSAGAGDERPEESVSLNFAKIEFDYTPQSASGGQASPVVFKWDLLRNETG
jgi:type VI secretion system secreted protein Hcp